MAKVTEGRLESPIEASDKYEITIYDPEMDVSVTFSGDEIAYLEWDGYPEGNFLDAEWFLIEIEGDEASYFPNYEDLDERARNAILDYCEGVYSGSIEQ